MNSFVILDSAELIFIIYFKICLYKFLCKFPTVKKSILTSSDFKSNFKLIKKCLRQMYTYLVGKSKNICFMIFHPCLDNFVYSGEFYPWRVLSSLEKFIQRREFGDSYLLQRLFSSVETSIQFQILLSSAENFIQCRDFYPVWRLLSCVDTFIHCEDFLP